MVFSRCCSSPSVPFLLPGATQESSLLCSEPAGLPLMLHCSPAAPVHTLQCWVTCSLFGIAHVSPLPRPSLPLSLSLHFDEAYFPIQYLHRSHRRVCILGKCCASVKNHIICSTSFLHFASMGLCASHCLGATL